ncbi:MAG: hypothetical protein HC932_05285 [Thermales bacterium]|nr:hypothetical protein [Thermales bacterium]
MSNHKNIKFFTDEGILEVSRIENGIAFDQYNRPIDKYHFRFQLEALNEEWINPNVTVKELA